MEANYKNICAHGKCTGCMACLSSCPHNSIIVKTDEYGFRYPLINLSTCVNCGLCYKTCPVNKPIAKIFPINCYAFALNDDNALHKVASGGAAWFISRNILERGGIVYGCSGEDMTNVSHVRIENIDDLYKLNGSKYVQSSMNTIGRSLLNDLKNEKLVLFIGTPCQVAGIRNCVRKDYPNFYTIDLVCHGVASQQMLNDNIKLYQKKYPDIDIDSISFRSKKERQGKFTVDYGWSFHRSDCSPVFIPWMKDPYMLGFLGDATFRDSCYQCDYAYSSRISDLTLADFWGLSESAGFIKGKGVSNILVNTEKGQQLIDTISDCPEITIKQRPIQEAISGNGQLMCPSKRSRSVGLFRQQYPKLGWEVSIKKAMSRFVIETKCKNIAKIIKRLLTKS